MRSFLSSLSLLVLVAGCKKNEPPPAPADAASDAGTFDVTAIDRAESLRRAQDVTPEARTSHDVRVRRRAARALARIADAASGPGLLRALADDDPETVAWGAFGLGASCPRGTEAADATVRALAARAASLKSFAAAEAAPAGAVDPRVAIVRAVGRCGGALAETTLAAWVGTGQPPVVESAAYALGDVAGARHKLGEHAVTALVDAATGRPDTPPVDAALHPFGRMDKVPEGFSERVLAAARGALARPGPARIFAVRALGRVGGDALPDLVHVVEDKGYLPAERAAAAQALGAAGKEGHAAAAEALAYLVPEKDPLAIAQLAGDDFGPMSALVSAIGDAAPPKKLEPSLYALAGLHAQGDASPSLARRVAELRCGAAVVLAQGGFDAAVLKGCAEEGSEAWERARLAALVSKKPMSAERRAAWALLAKSPHAQVREAAIDAIGEHPELKDAARAALADALASEQPGLVATAADVLNAHPDRAWGLARSEIRAALDPTAPPPSANPKEEIDPAVVAAMKKALAHAWSPDLVETRIALFQAAIALGMKEGKDAALAACHDPNVTTRQKAEASLRAASPKDAPTCAPPDDAQPPPADPPLARATKLRFTFDAGTLALTVDPALAPLTAARLAALARAGFYKGIVVHRVVPGFVVQLGDPGGDGFGGSGALLSNENSPVPFDALDVGIAIAGKDTGSSQLFVTLAKTPHLDGEYARVGRAEGDWWAIAQGDVVRDVGVEEQ